jgi:7-cyano-7-deazaguanine reductase
MAKFSLPQEVREESMILDNSLLGKKTEYVQTYSPQLLYPVPRTLGRELLKLPNPLPFCGVDIWNGFELSWLNSKGKPVIAMAEFHFPHTTPFIVESKSFKLYLNSFNQSTFGSFEEVEETMAKDLSQCVQGTVRIKIIPISAYKHEVKGVLLDELDVSTSVYEIDPSFLKTEREQVDETVYSYLLKSNCLATGQPDWGCLFIRYKGLKINHEGLLKYIISFRNHSGFAEHCVERIYCDLMATCHPENLTVFARYTRRGGLDINPFRSNFEEPTTNIREPRQ